MSEPFDKGLEKILEEAEREARAKLNAGRDEGHSRLMTDLVALLKDANRLQYHDMLNERYPAPKFQLAEHLRVIRQNVVDGLYDN